ncbi:MAG: IS66 family insertion sequence element accessory protein TnpB [Zoogloea sp.]|nr:IS66 family insertion sequence element accessory protein TnpB [Zoogloea sp.]
MFFPEGAVRVRVYGQPVDMRKSFSTASTRSPATRSDATRCRALFMFINRRGTQMKVLYWDRTGFCVWAKRLEEGRFVSNWAHLSTRQMDWTGSMLLEGIEPARYKRRFKRPENASKPA